MQIGTQFSFDQSVRRMRDLSGETARLQAEIATGKKLTRPSDDPVAFGRVTLIGRAMANDTQSASNVSLASTLLQQSDDALAGIETQLQRARELALRASNDILSEADRAAIATELDAIVEDMFTVANATDIRGTPLFGGAGSAPAFVRDAAGAISFAGFGEAPPIPIGESGSIAATDSGARLFGAIDAVAGSPRDIFKIVSDLATALSPEGPSDPDQLRAAIDDGLSGLAAAGERIGNSRASVGSRGARLELEGGRLAQLSADNEIARSGLEDADLSTSIAELQKTLLTLQATQASFTKVSQLSLFDYIR